MTFTKDDLKRVVWTFVQATLAVLISVGMDWVNGVPVNNWKALVVGAVAAGLAAVKNLVLADGTWAK